MMIKYIVLKEFVRITSKWVTIIGEQCKDSGGVPFQYWRVEKDHSLIILPVQKNHILIPAPVYRHGVGKSTCDLPGGRFQNNVVGKITCAAEAILNRELHTQRKDIEAIEPLFAHSLFINSSFSNQKLFACVASISDDWRETTDYPIARYSLSEIGMASLLEKLECLQCRAVLLEYLYQRKKLRSNNV